MAKYIDESAVLQRALSPPDFYCSCGARMGGGVSE